jgi:SCY1-like protein 1
MYLDTLLFLDEFQLKDSSEKQVFFKSLQSNLELFTDDIAKYKILPKLIHTYEYGEAGAHVLIPMFKLGRLLDEDEYQHRIVPCLVKLFSSSDRTTRVKLLERIDEFAPHLKPQIVNDKIYGNLITGFLDTNPAVREATVKAMVTFAEKLNYNNLNMDLMKYLAKLQGSDDQPGIRTNTTICLGKIGCYLDPSHRQRILINAFTRALKDPFPPARMAGVLAMSATQQFYSLIEVANKIVPSLSVLTVDPDKQVREQAFKAIKGFLEKLEKASENPEIIPELEAEVKAGGKASLLSTDKIRGIWRKLNRFNTNSWKIAN